MHPAERHFPLAALFNLVRDGHPVRMLSQPDQRQQDHQFEFAQIPGSCHLFRSNEEMAGFLVIPYTGIWKLFMSVLIFVLTAAETRVIL